MSADAPSYLYALIAAGTLPIVAGGLMLWFATRGRRRLAAQRATGDRAPQTRMEPEKEDA